LWNIILNENGFEQNLKLLPPLLCVFVAVLVQISVSAMINTDDLNSALN